MAKKKERIINPDDIILNDDDVMPEPETENYNETQNANADYENKILRPTAKFLKLFEECVGKLPYNTILTNSKNEKIKLTDLIKFVDSKQAGMKVADMNAIIAFIAGIDYSIIQPLMSIIDDSKRQSELWSL